MFNNFSRVYFQLTYIAVVSPLPLSMDMSSDDPLMMINLYVNELMQHSDNMNVSVVSATLIGNGPN